MDINVRVTIDEEEVLSFITKVFKTLHGNECQTKAATDPVIPAAPAKEPETKAAKHTLDELRVLCSQKKATGVKIKPIMQETTGASSFAEIPADKIDAFYAAVEAA